MKFNILGTWGIAIIHNDSVILIDALHDFYGVDYLPSDPKIIKSILNKQKPFKTILAIAFTHRHNDHFDSTLVSSVKNIYSSSLLIGGSQTKNLLSTALQNQFIAAKDSLTVTIKAGIFIKLTKVPHINPSRHASVENYRTEINWNGFRLIHFGDAAIEAQSFSKIERSVNVLIVPLWFNSYESISLLENLKPESIIFSHIAPNNKIKTSQSIKSSLNFFLNYGDTYSFKKKN